MGRWKVIAESLKHRSSMRGIIIGSFFGPFLGVSFSLFSIQHTSTGIASTIMALEPVFIILPAYILYKEKITIPELLGAVVSVAGVALFFV